MKIEITPTDVVILKHLAKGKCEDLVCDECLFNDYCTATTPANHMIEIARMALILGDIKDD